MQYDVLIASDIFSCRPSKEC